MLNHEPMRLVTGTVIPTARTRPCYLSIDPPSTCRKLLGLKMINEGPLQMFVEIRYRCSDPGVAKGRQNHPGLEFVVLST